MSAYEFDIRRSARKYKLTHERALEVFVYDPDTGILTWRCRRPGVRAGSVAGTINGNGYAQVTVDRVTYPAHRIVWLIMTGEWPVEIDHINRARADNRWDNLRASGHLDNQQNKGEFRNNTSGYKGVRKIGKNGFWSASVQVNKVRIYRHGFRSAESANFACCWMRKNFHAIISGQLNIDSINDCPSLRDRNGQEAAVSPIPSAVASERFQEVR